MVCLHCHNIFYCKADFANNKHQYFLLLQYLVFLLYRDIILTNKYKIKFTSRGTACRALTQPEPFFCRIVLLVTKKFIVVPINNVSFALSIKFVPQYKKNRFKMTFYLFFN